MDGLCEVNNDCCAHCHPASVTRRVAMHRSAATQCTASLSLA